MSQFLPETKEQSDVGTEHEIKEPPMFKVLLHNDDYTTMEFVVHVLMLVFRKSVEEATRIMLNVHHQGIGMCGVYNFEVAETKVDTVTRLARENGHPLRCTMEKA
jgi:ATP-dependent Clp protease adaptor protein ClpS